jgi:hypothetical protein
VDIASWAAPEQMTSSLETCRYAVLLFSKALFKRDDPSDAMDFLKNCQRESLWIVVLDLSLEEKKRPTVPKVGKEHRLYLFNSGVNSECSDALSQCSRRILSIMTGRVM